MAWAVMAMMGTLLLVAMPCALRTMRVASMPSITGMAMSISTRSNSCLRSAGTTSLPSVTDCTS